MAENEAINDTRTVALIERHEGREKYPYTDTTGKVTIGVGWNLTDNGLPEDIIDALLTRGYERALNAAKRYPWFKRLSGPRKAAIVNMIYNLGFKGFHSFKHLRANLEAGYFGRAAEEMLDSKWAAQVGYRAEELAEMMRNDKWLHE